MKPHLSPFEFVIWITWPILLIVGFFLFTVNKNGLLKKRIFPYFAAVPTLLMGMVLVSSGMPPAVLAIFLSALVLIFVLNLRSTTFCPNCGRTLRNNGLSLRKPNFCSHCGTSIEG